MRDPKTDPQQGDRVTSGHIWAREVTRRDGSIVWFSTWLDGQDYGEKSVPLAQWRKDVRGWEARV